MKKYTIAVVSGGYSDEAEVSFKSGNLVYANLNKEKYQAYHVRILENIWYADVDGQTLRIDKGDFSFELNGDKIVFDCVYNTIHGTPGEDGKLQAYWDIIGVPYTGCGFYTSALTFNKKDTLAVLNKYDVPHAQSVYLSQDDAVNPDQIIQKVGLPCFVKPNQSGSSLGISKVKEITELQPAIDKAFQEDSEILIESFLDGTEVSVGVINLNNTPTVLAITEIVSHTEFFDYEAKYLGKSDEITPARLSDSEIETVKSIALKVYNKLKMESISRAEYILVDGVPHFLEINTLPGLSPQSILPQQAEHFGLSLEELFANEIESALQHRTPKHD